MRISDESTEFDKVKRLEVYAEGQVRSARLDDPPRASAAPRSKLVRLCSSAISRAACARRKSRRGNRSSSGAPGFENGG